MLVWCTDLLSLSEEPSPGRSLPGTWYTPTTLTDQRPGGGRERKIRRVEVEWETRKDKKRQEKNGGWLWHLDEISEVEDRVELNSLKAKTVICSSLSPILSSVHSPIHPFIPHIHLTGRQALLAELDMRFMLSIGLKRRSRSSSPRYAFNPSNSWWEEKGRKTT